MFSDYEDRFQYFLVLSLLLLICEIFILKGKLVGRTESNCLTKEDLYVTKKTKYAVLLLMSLLILPGLSIAQEARSLTRRGNSFYEDSKFKEAEINYRKAEKKDSNSIRANYNLGNSLYKQDNFKEALQYYQSAVKSAAGKHSVKPSTMAKNMYNMGNTLLKSNQYKEAVDAYKQSLRINSQDPDARYNLTYALQKLKQQQQQQNKNKQGNDKDKNKDDKSGKNQDQNKKDDQNKKQDQNKQDQQNDKNNQQQNQQQPNKLSKDDAQRMLDALKNDEQKTLDKLRKQKAKAAPVYIEKDW